MDIQHWEKAWLITEEGDIFFFTKSHAYIFYQKFKVRKKSKYSFEFIELKDSANMEKFKELGMRIHNDLVGVRDNLAALLKGSKSRTFQTHKKDMYNQRLTVSEVYSSVNNHQKS